MLILLVRQKQTIFPPVWKRAEIDKLFKTKNTYKVSLLFSQFEKIKAVTITMYDKSILFKK